MGRMPTRGGIWLLDLMLVKNEKSKKKKKKIKIVGDGRNLHRSSCPTPHAKAGHLQQVAQINA